MSAICKTYTRLTDRQYNARVQYYSAKAFQEQENWENFTYNAVMRAVESADPIHLERLIEFSRDLQKYRTTTRIVYALAWPWSLDRKRDEFKCRDENGNLKALTKGQKAKLAKLRVCWESDFITAMDREEIHQAQKDKPAPSDWSKWEQGVVSAIVKRIEFARANNAPQSIIDKLEAAKQAAA